MDQIQGFDMNDTLRFPAAVTEISNSDLYTGRTRPSLSMTTPMAVPHKTASPWGGNSPQSAAFIRRLHQARGYRPEMPVRGAGTAPAKAVDMMANAGDLGSTRRQDKTPGGMNAETRSGRVCT